MGMLCAYLMSLYPSVDNMILEMYTGDNNLEWSQDAW